MPVVCHICGREFGTASINLHIPRCESKWEARQSKLPSAERRPVPSRPAILEQITSDDFGSRKGRRALKEYNDKVFDDFNKQVLEPCPNCNRTFRPEALTVHLRSCKNKSNNDKSKNDNHKAKLRPLVLKKPKTIKSEENVTNNNNQNVNNNEDDEIGEPTRHQLGTVILESFKLKSIENRMKLIKFIEELDL